MSIYFVGYVLFNIGKVGAIKLVQPIFMIKYIIVCGDNDCIGVTYKSRDYFFV